ncbi:serine/threonine-protein phosphatase CPPED1 isoform X1 [Pleurodeles waltl]|uniref:serine/threonine-protein phosphatase CPPED1 isoform X1 n=1 Tax=Pleurodeles waltl TaxID=8319 RepID=UPI00370966F0
MANEGQVFLLARDRTFSTFSEAEESEWKGPFYFIQGADPQFGLMKAWAMGDCDNGGDEWDQEIRLTEEAVKAINKLNPKPKFLVLCGDLIHAMPGTPWQKEQERDLKSVLQNISEDIPLVFVSGNHDIGNTPTPDTIAAYCKSWGDDYFSFWVGGVFFIVLNSQFFFDSSKCGELKEAHDQWLEAQLVKAKEQKCKYAIIFQHIPLFLKNIDEDEDYFNIQKTLRHELVEKFQKAGIKAVFSGHYHRNAGGVHKGLDMVVTSAIGCQLGEDDHGVRVVVVTADKIVHRYYSLKKLGEEGIQQDFLDLMKQE